MLILDGIPICNMVLITLHFSRKNYRHCVKDFSHVYPMIRKTALWQAILCAFKLGLTCPEKYAGIASLSGGFGVDICARLNNENFYPTLGEDIFGDPEKFKGSKHDLFALAKKRKEEHTPMPKFYMWCGVDDFLIEQNREMNQTLKELDYDYVYKEAEGDHSWKYWDVWIQDILNWIDQIRKEAD